MTDEHRPPPNPVRTTHLDTAWDEPTYTDQHEFDIAPEAAEEEGPALPPPRSVAPPRVMGNASVPPPPLAKPLPPPAASGPPAGPASSRPSGPVKGGEAIELTPVPQDEPQIPQAPRVPAPPVPNQAKQSVPPAPPKPGMGIAPAPPKPGARATGAPPPPPAPSPGQPVAPPGPAQPAASAQPPVVEPAAVQPTQPTQATPSAEPAPPPTAPSLDPMSSPARSPAAPLELLPASHSLPVSLGEHLGRRILLGGFAVPSWMLSATAVFAATAVAGIVTAAVVGAMSSAQADPAPPAASSAPAPAVASTSDVPVVDLASAGDPTALKQLEAKPVADRTVDETIALASGEAVKRKAALGELASDLRRNPNLGQDPDVMKRLREATEDAELARDALRLIASLPGSTPVDVIYDIWIGTKGRTPTTKLAEALVFTKEVRAKASPALAVALDLRATETCEEVKPVVARAIEHGDRRSLRLLGKLQLRHGCGPSKSKDCWACLRDEDTLVDAIKAVMKRPEPKL